MGKLYIVGSPIGNLGDFSERAKETLNAVDLICAEDTRVTSVLTNKFGIKKPMISYHQHNAKEKGEQILARLLEGESCAVITDAGMPCISDPGEEIVKLCAEHDIEVAAVPGPTAALTALAVSGLPTKRFCFEGFLSVTKSIRREHLLQLKPLPQTLIFYEAPHKLKNTLNDLLELLGDRRISLCRELTKIHEEVIRGTVSEMIALYEQKEPKGEYVLIVEGAREEPKPQITVEEAAEMARELTEKGIKASDACKEIAAKTEFSKSEIYKALQR
ncbi:MAG: 16S rRNA (cytidine(1402)-2'-O)-methyltransferase [Firmicutes bacterium]|nr:16S rRNA (cytidine(1402)-2'-O)-methyltransferase [[Eubacterium] siraeum]MCM1487911.1 16S rRNA (cytidine(1402)-2'-O)-methyltransferase [Bacillota bacterium]